MQRELFRAPSREVPVSPVVDRAHDRERLRSTLESPLEFATAQQPYPRGTGLRTECREIELLFGRPIGEGYSDFIQFSDDLCGRVVSARAAVPVGIRCLGEDWLKIEVYVSGRQSLVFEGIGQIDLNARWCHIHLHPDGMAKGDWTEQGVVGTGLILYLRPAFIRERLGDAIERLPEELRSFASDELTSFFFETLPVSAGMAAAVADVVSNPFLGSLRHLYVESRAMEIVSCALHALTRPEESATTSVRLRQRDIERLHFLRSVVERDYADPRPIAELARRIGLNQQKLKCGFKALFGMTIFECYQNKRLAVAADLLENKDASVTEAALAAGYEYPSNFAIAFKRKYGIPPKRARKRRG